MEPIQRSLVFEQRWFVAQTDFARKIIQVWKKSVGAQCVDIVVQTHAASTRNTKALQLGTALQIGQIDLTAFNERKFFQVGMKHIKYSMNVGRRDLGECDAFKLQ